MTRDHEHIRRMLAQSLVVGLPGSSAGPEEMELVAEHGLGGVILFARNYESPDQVWELNHGLSRAAREAGRPPLLIMVDQEGGSVARLKDPFTSGPDLAELGQSGDPDLLWGQGRQMGRELLAAGFNWNLAPVLDVHRPGGLMARRSLGQHPHQVSSLGRAFIQGLQATGCLACAKHFPGLGRAALDTHQACPRVELTRGQLEEVELVPFRHAAQQAAGVMVCHAVFPALDPKRPASLSFLVIQGLLRRELGYGGLVLSDDLEMGALAGETDPAGAAVQAYLAGCDLLLVCHRPAQALLALERLTELALCGELPPARLEETASRIARIKRELRPLPPPRSELSALLSKKV